MADYTEHYQLHQWQPEDPFLRTDFNADLAKIDTALGALNQSVKDQATELDNKGNCQVITGTYVGEGKSEIGNPNILEFSHRPLMVIVHPEIRELHSFSTRLVMLQGSSFSFCITNSDNYFCDVSWEGNSVFWSGYGLPQYRCDEAGVVYRYVALMSMDET